MAQSEQWTGLAYTKQLNEVTTFRAQVFCPKDDNELRYTGYVLTSIPPQYPHECPTCGYKVSLDASYPRIEYR